MYYAAHRSGGDPEKGIQPDPVPPLEDFLPKRRGRVPAQSKVEPHDDSRGAACDVSGWVAFVSAKGGVKK